jgi:hypothetical protein
VFACYQASIGDQFEFLQQTWANNASFPQAGAGPDPVIGVAGAGEIPNASGSSAVNFSTFIAIEGALYLFTPSIPTLELLATGGALPQP